MLGYAVSADSDDDWVTITGPGPQMSFQLAPDHVPPTWPKNDVPQQAYVDFFVTDIVAAHQRVLALGGRAIDRVEPPAPSPPRGSCVRGPSRTPVLPMPTRAQRLVTASLRGVHPGENRCRDPGTTTCPPRVATPR